jgi:lipopolysaccharide biosynthesis glycosyltransferase
VTNSAQQSDGPVVLSTAGDDRFAMPMAVMLFSAIVNLPADLPVTVYILDAGIGAANRQRIKDTLLRSGRQVTTEFLSADLSVFDGVPMGSCWNATTYARLLLPELVSADCKKVLFLDGDMIVRANVLELWRQELTEDEGVAAVRDAGVVTIGGPLGIVDILKQAGLRGDERYFNAGVLLINVDYWRRHNIGRRVIEFVTRFHDFIHFPDQDGLNAIFAGQWREWDMQWNTQVGAIRNFHNWPESDYREQIRPRLATALKEAKILHFTGLPKPWAGGIRSPVRPAFDEYLKKSGWFSALVYPFWVLNRHRVNAMDILRTLYKQRFGSKKK